MATAKQSAKRRELYKIILHAISSTLAIAGMTISLFLIIIPFEVSAVTRAQTLHDICKQARLTQGSTVVTDLDTECAWRAIVGGTTSTYFNYYSGDNFCVRTVVDLKDYPDYDQTYCQPTDLTEEEAAEAAADAQRKLDAASFLSEEAVRVVGDKLDYLEGTVSLVRNDNTQIVTPDISLEPGDVILTDKMGFVDIISDGNSTWLSGDSTLGIAEIGTVEPEKVIAPDEPLDPQNFQMEELKWWQKIGLYFASTYNPDVYKTAEMYGVKKATILYRGSAYITEKTNGSTEPKMVVTPTTAIIPNGTTYLVEVDDDETTTVTTLEGQVLVADIRSGNVATVNANQSVTVPKTTKGLSAKEIQGNVQTRILQMSERWWMDKIAERALQAAKDSQAAGKKSNEAYLNSLELKNMLFFVALALIAAITVIASAIIKAKAAKK